MAMTSRRSLLAPSWPVGCNHKNTLSAIGLLASGVLAPLTANVPSTPHQAPAGLTAGHSRYAPTVDHVQTRAPRLADLRNHSGRLMKRGKCYCMRRGCDG